MTRPFALFVLACCTLLSAPTQAQNLLGNPGFDIDLSVWENAYGRTGEWDELDFASSALSGSALLTNDTGPGGYSAIRSQCAEVTPGVVYRLGGQIFPPSGQLGTGVGLVYVRFYANPGCYSPLPGALFTSTASALDAWTAVSTLLVPPAGYGYAFVNLAVRVYEGDSFSIHFDDLDLHAESDAIFYDGFELENTDGWSSASG